MSQQRGRQRGTKPPMTRRARLTIASLIGATIVGMAVAIAVAVKQDTCDIDVRIPEERQLVCELQRRGGTEQCPPEDVMSRERCEELIADLAGHETSGS